MLGSAVRSLIERRAFSAPPSTIAAWFLELPEGRVLFAVNEAVCDSSGAVHFAESWFRLRALLLARPFGVLFASDIAAAGLLDAFTHLPL